MPIAAIVALAIVWNRPLGWALIVVVALALIAAVLAAVHHAEVVALRVGEPFGTLILAVAVTVIEVGLIVSVMLAGGPTATVVARDAVYRGGDDHDHRHHRRVPAGRRIAPSRARLSR